jgi:uncharacterized protein (DUF1778 family)
MARPKNVEGERVPFQVRLSTDEKAALDRAAKAAGLSTSTWMRSICLQAARAVKPVAAAAPPPAPAVA